MNATPPTPAQLLASSVGEHARLVEELLVLIGELSAKIRSYAASGEVFAVDPAAKDANDLAIKWLQTSLTDLAATIAGLETNWLVPAGPDDGTRA